jgi:hypothetical protein
VQVVRKRSYLALFSVGTNIASSNAITAITTKSSINVKPFDLHMMVLLHKEGSSKPTFYFKT